jgi:hypothetical protein
MEWVGVRERKQCVIGVEKVSIKIVMIIIFAVKIKITVESIYSNQNILDLKPAQNIFLLKTKPFFFIAGPLDFMHLAFHYKICAGLRSRMF